MNKSQILNIITILLIFSNMFIWSGFKKLNSNLEINFFDIGQGDSILIKTPDNHYALIDGGRDSQVLDQISNFMPPTINTLEFVLLTHPDLDHIGGIIDVLSKYNIKNIFLADIKKDTEAFIKIKKDIQDYGIKNFSLTELNDFTWDNIEFDVLWPIHTTELETFEEVNDTSITLMIRYNNFSAYFSGDLESKYEQNTIQALADKSIDVLKTGHHGSKSSTSEEFLQETSPKVAVISVGAYNSYGHPSLEVINKLDDNHVNIYRTDQDGSITVKVFPDNFQISSKSKFANYPN